MSNRVEKPMMFLMRNIKSLDWKYMIIIPSKFDPRKFPGWRYYKSFHNNGEGKEKAKAYAIQVELDEKTIAERGAL